MRTEMEARNSISVIIPVYNNLQIFQICLNFLRAFRGEYVKEIIVVDNNSNMQTRAWLSMQNDIIVIRNEKNLGKSVAFNQGAEIATGKYLLLMHSDVCITPNAISNAIHVLEEDNRIGIVGLYSNRSLYAKVNVNYTTIDSMIEWANKTEKTLVKRYSLIVGDLFMLVRSKAYGVNGGFDERFANYLMADFDFCMRMHMHGYHCYLINGFVHHDVDSYEDNNIDSLTMLDEGRKIFKLKWDTNPLYSTNIRGEVLSLMDIYKDKLTVLDVGCACGGNLMTIKLNNPTADTYGIEFNEKTAAVASCYGEVSAMDVEKVNRDDWQDKFDYIICADVLEHLHNPWQALSNLGTFLKKDGKVIVSLPNVGHISIINDLLHGRWTYEEAGILDKTHLRFFTKNTAVDLINSSGLKILDIRAALVSANTDNGEADIYKKLRDEGLLFVPEAEAFAYQFLIVAGK